MKATKISNVNHVVKYFLVLTKHIHTIHEVRKDHKCESCGKSFSEAGNLKKHICTVHEGHKDFKCESCGK